MKFKFCGELDAPEWILKEIDVISKLPNLRVRVIAGQVVAQLLGGSIEYEKVEKFIEDAHLSRISDTKATLAALRWILTNAAKYDVDDTTLSNELGQLGLPKDICDAVVKPYNDNKDKLRNQFRQNILKLPRLQSSDWRIDLILNSSLITDVFAPSVQLKLNLISTDGTAKETTFELSEEKFKLLLSDLRTARSLMDLPIGSS